MLLVGWQALKTIQGHPDLESRVIAQVAFEPLTGKDLFDYLYAAYPFLAETPKPVLQAVNDQFARGNLREWRNFTEALTVMGMVGELDYQQADGILSILRVNR